QSCSTSSGWQRASEAAGTSRTCNPWTRSSSHARPPRRWARSACASAARADRSASTSMRRVEGSRRSSRQRCATAASTRWSVTPTEPRSRSGQSRRRRGLCCSARIFGISAPPSQCCSSRRSAAPSCWLPRPSSSACPGHQLDVLVAVLPRRVDRAEPILSLPEIRICAVLEQQFAQLEAHRGVLVLAGGGRVEGGRLDMGVARERVRIGAALDEGPGRVDVAEEASEAECLEAVVTECVREGGVLVEEPANAVGLPERRSLEDIELRRLRQQLVDTVVLASIERFEQLGHGHPPRLILFS